MTALTQCDQAEMADTSQRKFLNAYPCMMLYCDINLIDVWSYGLNEQRASIGSDDGLAPMRQQAIIWTNDGLLHWSIYASRGYE